MIRALLFLLFATSPAVADPDRVAVLLGSHHIGAAEEFEEVNPGLFLEWETEGPSYSVGIFRNSYGRASIAAAAHWPIYERGGFLADITAGAAYYPEDGRTIRIAIGDVVPILGIRARYKSAYLLAVPNDGAVADYVVGFGLTFALP